ncbi:hypothetical protein [Caulobacter radicis]|uniref:hypothetical protein n=1 Tax=Caulobacter radicis TaxID=2172650 RepID=UPI001AD7F72E|nr:hypothetical protein [Caulobacter radicis]
MMFQCMTAALAPVSNVPFPAAGMAGGTRLAGSQDDNLSYAVNERPTSVLSGDNLARSSRAADSLPANGAKVAGETRANGRTLPLSAPIKL